MNIIGNGSKNTLLVTGTLITGIVIGYLSGNVIASLRKSFWTKRSGSRMIVAELQTRNNYLVDILRTIHHLMDVVERDIIPLACGGVSEGNPATGAALVLRDNLFMVCSSTNRNSYCPIFHPEIVVIGEYFDFEVRTRPQLQHCFMLSTHPPEPFAVQAIRLASIPICVHLFSSLDTEPCQGDLQLFHAITSNNHEISDPHAVSIESVLKLLMQEITSGRLNVAGADDTIMSTEDMLAMLSQLGREAARAQQRLLHLHHLFDKLHTVYTTNNTPISNK